MKIAVIRQRYNPFGGAERFVELALAGLAKHDQIEVTLLTRAWQKADQSLFKCTILSPFFLGSTWRDYGFGKAACKAVEKGGFDLVQAHERVPCCDVFRAGDGLHQRWLEQRKTVLGPIRRLWLKLNPFNIYTLAAERRMFANSRLKAVICISHMVRNEIKAAFNLPDRMLHVIYNGVDLKRFSPALKAHRQATRTDLGVPLDRPLFLFLGSGFERKGLETAIRALPSKAWLLIIGKDNNSLKYKKLGSALGVSERLIFAGPRNDVELFYGAADAFVFPTIYEPFGNVVLEAMASGLPVVTSTSCGAGELITDGIDGYVLGESQDVNAWRQRMEQLCEPMTSHAMGMAAALRAADCDVGKMVDTMVGLYQALIVAQTKNVVLENAEA